MQKSKLQLRFQKLVIVIVVGFMVSASWAQAASFYFEPGAQEVGVGQVILVNFFIDTQGEKINALEGIIKLPTDLLEVQRLSDGNTIINFWAEKPIFDEENNQIRFSGIIPGGFSEKSGLIFSATFFAREQGEGKLEVQEAKVLLNDGKGTAVNVLISPLEIIVSNQALPFSIEVKEDLEPPEAFMPEIANDSNMFEGKWFLAFATQDKGSGIADYEIYETTRKKETTRIDANHWVKARSPYILKDQNLQSYIYVKAVDNDGNERIAIVKPRYPMKWYEIWENWVILIMVVIFLLLFISRLSRIRSKGEWKKQ